MLGIYLGAVLAASAPQVEAGPDLAQAAKITELPIREVTVYSDRAKVQRATRIPLAAGSHVLRLNDLPGAVLMNTVQVGAQGGKVLRVEVVPVERERISLAQVEELIIKLEKAADQIARIDADSAVLGNEAALLTQARPKPPVAEAERVGKPLPAVDVSGWKRSLDFVDLRLRAIQDQLRQNAIKREVLSESYTQLQREVARYDLGAFSDRKIQVLAIVDVKSAGKVKLEMSYFVPGASWWPAYDLHLSPTDGKVSLSTAGLVQQASGEAWDNATLALSTAIPGQSIELPELLTWTLGERRDFTPRPRPEKSPARAQRYSPPVPQARLAQAERAAAQHDLQQRLALLSQLASSDVTVHGVFDYRVSLGQSAGLVAKSEDGRGYSSLGKRRSGHRSTAAPKKPQPPSRGARRAAPSQPMPVMEPEPSMDMAPADYDDDVAGESAMPDVFGGVVDTAREMTRDRRVRTSLALYDPTTWRRPSFGDRSLPAMIAGGLDYVYRTPTPASVPSDGQRLRVPLASKAFKAQLRYEATPALSKTAYLTATVQNKGSDPILQGPVNIFVGGAFTGEGQLATTGPGGKLVLPLGADENIRLTHHVAPQTRTDGIFIKDDITEYTTRIEVGNYKGQAIEIDIYDVLPGTNNEKIEVKLCQSKPRLAAKPDAKGRLRWRLRIPPHKTQTIVFSYTIKRPQNWQLGQR